MKVKLPNGQVVTMIDNEESRAEIAKDNPATFKYIVDKIRQTK